MHIALKHLPSPLTGEGSGGAEDSTSPPILTFLRRRVGVLTSPCQLTLSLRERESACRRRSETLMHTLSRRGAYFFVQKLLESAPTPANDECGLDKPAVDLRQGSSCRRRRIHHRRLIARLPSACRKDSTVIAVKRPLL
jgi:hypothetical protein